KRLGFAKGFPDALRHANGEPDCGRLSVHRFLHDPSVHRFHHARSRAPFSQYPDFELPPRFGSLTLVLSTTGAGSASYRLPCKLTIVLLWSVVWLAESVFPSTAAGE